MYRTGVSQTFFTKNLFSDTFWSYVCNFKFQFSRWNLICFVKANYTLLISKPPFSWLSSSMSFSVRTCPSVKRSTIKTGIRISIFARNELFHFRGLSFIFTVDIFSLKIKRTWVFSMTGVLNIRHCSSKDIIFRLLFNRQGSFWITKRLLFMNGTLCINQHFICLPLICIRDLFWLVLFLFVVNSFRHFFHFHLFRFVLLWFVS